MPRVSLVVAAMLLPPASAEAGRRVGWDGAEIVLGDDNGSERDHATVAIGPSGDGVVAYEEVLNGSTTVITAGFTRDGVVHPERYTVDVARVQTHPQVAWASSEGPLMCWDRSPAHPPSDVAWSRIDDRGMRITRLEQIRTDGGRWTESSFCDATEVNAVPFVVFQGGGNGVTRPSAHVWSVGMPEAVAVTEAVNVQSVAVGDDGVVMTWAESLNRDRRMLVRVAEFDTSARLIRGPTDVTIVDGGTVRLDVVEVDDGYTVGWVESDQVMLARLNKELGVKAINQVATGRYLSLTSAGDLIGLSWSELIDGRNVFTLATIDFQTGKRFDEDMRIGSGPGNAQPISDLDMRFVDDRLRGAVTWQHLYEGHRHVFIRFFSGRG